MADRTRDTAPDNMASITSAVQSVVFFIFSCSTCNQMIYRRKTKIQAEKDRKEKAIIETAQPGIYYHPSPFATNPYWEEEIAMGPNPKRKKATKQKAESQRAIMTAGAGSSVASSSRAVSIEPGSSPTTLLDGSRISGEGWNRKLYQRENEPLWGLDTPGRIRNVINKATSTAERIWDRRPSTNTGDSESEDEEERTGRNPYYHGRNPPVNDLHPPVVSTNPVNPDELSWMRQPPPSAKIMAGKERVESLRSRAGSNVSSQQDTPLSRRVTVRSTGGSRLQPSPPFPELRPGSSRQTTGMREEHRRSTSQSSEADSIGARRKRGALAVVVPAVPAKAVLKSEMRERPRLGTIVSEEVLSPRKGETLTAENIPLPTTPVAKTTTEPVTA